MKSRKLFTLLTGVYTLVAGYAFAQNNHETKLLKSEPVNKGAEKMISAVPGVITNAKSTALMSRMVGVMYARHDGANYAPVDSYAYKYSGNRGGDLMSDVLKYDNGRSFTYNTGMGSYSDDTRYTQTFDAQNNILITLYEKWDMPSTSWKNDYQYLYTYDSKNNMTGSIGQSWNGTSSKWVNEEQTLYTYDANNNLLTQVYRTWIVSSETWRNENKYTYTYDANSNYLSKLYQDWDNSNNVWDNINQYLYTYDASKNMLSEIYMTWSTMSSNWRNSSKTGYTYDSDNNAIQRLYQTWDSPSSSWKNSNQNLYTYDTVAVKNLLKDVYQTWGFSSWSNNTQTMYTYDATGNRLTEQGQTWSFSSWRNSYLHTSTFDSRHNQLSHLQQTWSNTTSAWVNSRMYDYGYNNYDQMTLTQSNTWNAGGFWFPVTNDYRYRYYYEEYGTTSVANIEKANGTLTLYPVPATNYININLKWDNQQAAVIGIYDMNGRVVAQWQVASTNTYSNTMSVANLTAGNYVIRIKGEKEQITQQFAVVR